MGKKFLGLGGTDHFWDRAKAWILNQITSAVAAKIAEVVANAPEDLDTLKEIADWIKAHANDAAAMNTQITENKNNIASLSDGASAMNTQIQTNKNNIAALQTSVAGKADKAHTHSTGDITSGTLPIANGGTGATTAKGAQKSLLSDIQTETSAIDDTSEFVMKYGTPTDTKGAVFKRSATLVWNYIKNKISSVLGLTASDYSGRARTATNADYSKKMYQQVFDLTSLDKTKFYPLVCSSGTNFAEVAICSEGGWHYVDYNQNRIHFDISTQGWNDLPTTLNIREYACFDNNEITIGCIGRGTRQGAWAIWLRGGIFYTCFSRDSDLSLHTSNYAYGEEVYTIGTNYYGGSNTNVEIMFTPQSTISEGAYSSRQITATGIKANNKLRIPIGAPSSLEDGCIWIS